MSERAVTLLGVREGKAERCAPSRENDDGARYGMVVASFDARNKLKYMSPAAANDAWPLGYDRKPSSSISLSGFLQIAAETRKSPLVPPFACWI